MKRSRAEMMTSGLSSPLTSSSSSCMSENDPSIHVNFSLSNEMKTMNIMNGIDCNTRNMDDEKEEKHTSCCRNSINTSTSTLSPINCTMKMSNKKEIFAKKHSFTSSTTTTNNKTKKGVSYSRDGFVLCCRFCEILLHAQNEKEEFLYEDDQLAIFRPHNPMADTHILVVPKIHIRNVNELTSDHVQLLKNMRQSAEKVLRCISKSNFSSSTCSSCTSSSELFKFAFHTPPFNSIDHVHMHAFQVSCSSSSRRRSYVGQIKYCTETWWCRSYEGILSRLMTTTKAQKNKK